MKKIKLLIFSIGISAVSFSQAKSDTTVTDSTYLLSINDVNTVLQALESKLLASDHKVVANYFRQVLQIALNRKFAEIEAIKHSKVKPTNK